MNYKSYEEALRKGGTDIWPCGRKGKDKKCGRIHNYYWTTGNGKKINCFRCWQNSEKGCPDDNQINRKTRTAII